MQNSQSRVPCRKSFHIECKTDSRKGRLKVEHNWKIFFFSHSLRDYCKVLQMLQDYNGTIP